MRGLYHDLRFSVRSLRRSPVFTIAALLSLALGIGGATALFSVVDALVLKPLPYEEPGDIVQLFLREDTGRLRTGFTYEEFRRVRDSARTFEGIGAYSFLPVALRADEQTKLVQSEVVTGDYFDVVRQRPILGSLPSSLPPAEAERAILLSHGLWQEWFQGDPDVVGRVLWIDDHPLSVAGVMPRGFGGISPIIGVDLWLPAAARQNFVYNGTGQGEPDLELRWLSVVGRLAEGASLQSARAEAGAGGRWLAELGDGPRRITRVEVFPYTGIGVPGQSRDALGLWTGVFIGLIALVLLLACSNVANLLLVRAVERRPDLGVRLTFGAPRRRLLRLLLMESVALAVVGGGLGFLLALWATRLFETFLPRVPSHLSYTLDFSPDMRVLAATFGVSVLCGLVFGLVPALMATSSEVMNSVREGSYSSTASRGSSRFQRLLVAAQVAISAALLVVAVLQVRSVQRSLSVSTGFSTDAGVAITLDHSTTVTTEEGGSHFAGLVSRMAALPGVDAAVLADRPPLSGRRSTVAVARRGAGERTGHEPRAEELEVGPGFFRTLGVQVLAGRGFRRSDGEAGSTAVISRSLADELWGLDNPLGDSLVVGDGARVLQIVGVVEDIRYTTISGDDTRMIYRPLDSGTAAASILLRVSGDPLALFPLLRRTVDTEAPNGTILDLATFRQLLDNATLPHRSLAVVFGGLAVAGLLLTTCGIFGVVSYSVRRRRREVAIRMAFGADKGRLLRLVLGQTLLAVGLGLGVGLAASAMFGFALRGFLFQMEPFDPATYLVVFAVIGLMALAAAWWPGWQTLSTAPSNALREE